MSGCSVCVCVCVCERIANGTARRAQPKHTKNPSLTLYTLSLSLSFNYRRSLRWIISTALLTPITQSGGKREREKEEEHRESGDHDNSLSLLSLFPPLSLAFTRSIFIPRHHSPLPPARALAAPRSGGQRPAAVLHVPRRVSSSLPHTHTRTHAHTHAHTTHHGGGAGVGRCAKSLPAFGLPLLGGSRERAGAE